ncbi:MAG: DNA repair protein RecN (Recombination protein N) [Acidimicrobiales bacterium]|jgi:DNA repair protein RecN (Recombination protein N)
MLLELAVADLGVIESLTLQLPPGLIALTGETGAGKTLLVDAIDLLMGGRADPGLVRPGAAEATVDGRFELDGDEVVLTRVVPAEGRSRAYINGRPATVSALADVGAKLVDLHGQHAHQSLLGVDAQRAALDQYGHIDVEPLRACRKVISDLEATLIELGGDERTRARELDLLRYQVRELEDAAIEDASEDQRLVAAEERLANAVDHQAAAEAALLLIGDEGGARDEVARAMAGLEDRPPFADESSRLRNVLAELDDLADAIRSIASGIDHDPEALAEVQERRHLLQQLCRKYGDDLSEVIAEHAALADRLTELEGHDERAARLDADVAEAAAELAKIEAAVLASRKKAAPKLAKAIASYLPDLAMDKAKVGVDVSGSDGGRVAFLLSANPGSPLQPLSKVASGGELARAMLALRSVLSEAPPILVFDEVDAGIGGETGFAVGRSLAALGDRHQVLVVTHLPQVAAFADAHLAVEKRQGEDKTVSQIRLLNEKERQIELARMLSGQPDSRTARKHARELLAEAAKQKAASGT